MKPYFDTGHVAGLLFLIVVLAWAAMELSEFSRMQPGREGATKIGRRSFWLAAAQHKRPVPLVW